MKHFFWLTVTLILISCTKGSIDQTQSLKLVKNETMVVYLLNDQGYTQHPNAIVFKQGYDTRNVHAIRRIDTFNDGLYFSHHFLLTGDTTVSHPFPFNSFSNDSGFTYAYAVPEIQNDPDLVPWFNKQSTNWMSKHECVSCSHITTYPQDVQYFTKITCTVKK